MAQVVCESKRPSGVKSSMQPCAGNLVAIGGAVGIMPGLSTHLMQDYVDLNKEQEFKITG